jgi:hypothetical protein
MRAVKFGALEKAGSEITRPEKTQNERPFFINFNKLFSDCA